jgi:hypothetical protein
MATWAVTRLRRKTAVTYTNSVTGQSMSCGDQHPDTSVPLILNWIVEQADAGDAILVDRRLVLVVQSAASA